MGEGGRQVHLGTVDFTWSNSHLVDLERDLRGKVRLVIGKDGKLLKEAGFSEKRI